jgi:hypothetical protein
MKMNASAVLGFNEPDHSDQANMNINQIKQYWPQVLEEASRDSHGNKIKRVGSIPVAGDYNLLDQFMSAEGTSWPCMCTLTFEFHKMESILSQIL